MVQEGWPNRARRDQKGLPLADFHRRSQPPGCLHLFGEKQNRRSSSPNDLKVSANGNQLQGEGVKPWIRTDFGYLPVHRGNSVNISCRFDGNPRRISIGTSMGTG
ncbi:unnamed protein product, partial [Mesorhabditis belari]|uniref:Uncharacterized protein n=1 Tax=Mesorhabditis belari TaxID=2138241 RepID=A0AAF3J1N2_9BILA